MYLEKPSNCPNFVRPDDTKIKVEGWAVSNDNKASLRVFLDNNCRKAKKSLKLGISAVRTERIY